jgi:Fe2+ or Zn2+ uptake regulation protein
MEKITKSMEKKGVRLTDRERSVLNIFWSQSPYKK